MKSIMEKIVCPVLVLLMILSMVTGCTSKDGTKNTTEQETTLHETDQKGESKGTEVLQPVTISWYLRPTAQNDMDLVVKEMNDKFFKPMINAELKIKRVDPANYSQMLMAVLAAGDEFDLCHSAPRYGYYENIAKGAFLPLDDLLKEYAPKGYAQIPAKIWDAAKVDGKIYGFMNYQIFGRQFGLFARKEMVEKYNFDLKTVNKLEDFEPLLAKMKAGEGKDNIVFGTFKSGYWKDLLTYFGLDQIGSTNSPGVVSTSDDNLKVFNQYESPEFESFVRLMRDWYNKGYILKDASVNDNKREILGAGKVLSDVDNIKPGGLTDLENIWKGIKLDYKAISTPYVTTDAVTGTMTSVSRTSKNPERAMMLLELVNTNKDVYNMLCFGIEDKHYKKVGDNRIEPIADSGYSPNFAWMVGNQFNAYLQPAQPDNVWEETMALNESADASKTLGFTFNPEPIKNELAQCASVIEEYGPGLWTGSVDVDKYLPEFINKLKTVGSDKIIAEEQRQIDEWKKTK